MYHGGPVRLAIGVNEFIFSRPRNCGFNLGCQKSRVCKREEPQNHGVPRASIACLQEALSNEHGNRSTKSWTDE